VKVSNDRCAPSLFGNTVDDVRDGLCGLIVVHCDPHHLGACTGERGNLLDGALDICGVGIGHGLYNDRCIRPDANTTNVDSYCMTTLDLRHKFSIGKFIIRGGKRLAIH
jgi:hypothetical protein